MIFSRKFWKDLAERAVSTAAQAAIATFGVDQAVDAIHLDWKYIGGVAAGGALLATLKAFAKLGTQAASAKSAERQLSREVEQLLAEEPPEQ